MCLSCGHALHIRADGACMTCGCPKLVTSWDEPKTVKGVYEDQKGNVYVKPDDLRGAPSDVILHPLNKLTPPDEAA